MQGKRKEKASMYLFYPEERITEKRKGCVTAKYPHPLKSVPYPVRKGISDAPTLSNSR